MPAAHVVLRAGMSVASDDLRQFCRARLAGYKVPAAIRFVAVLPRTPAGKLQRRLLADP